jgi:diguanylate cyclase (GGDEF)-like protein
VIWFKTPAPPVDLLRAQVQAFARQVPLMYAMVLVNTFALAATHWRIAPVSLTVWFPGLLAVVSVWRWVLWWRARGQILDDAAARRMLRKTLLFAGLLGCGFTVWSFGMFPYGDAFAQAHVLFYMAITSIGCVFCLMHMRAAAFLLTGLVVGPITLFLISSGNPILEAIGLNLALVAVTMIIILLIAYRDFANLVESRRDLQARQADIQRLSDEYLRLANLDGLTGLPNRRLFFEHLSGAIQAAAEAYRGFAVGVIDLDGFKPVNDAYGHAVGDKVLIEAGARLSREHGAPLFVARLGGDEFGLVVDADLDHEAIERLGASLCEALGAPYCLPGHTAQVSGSVGFAVYPYAGATPELLYERADYALYHAKQNLRGRTVVFSAEHETAIRRAGLIEQELRHADMEREFSLVYQPLVDVRARRTIGFEALARWTSPTLGVVSPGEFIAVAERSGLIAQLSPVLLEWALRAAARWPDEVRLAFNLSARDIGSSEQMARVVEVIMASGVAPDRIDLEVTETAVMRDLVQAEHTLNALKALGVRIALDDFGAGYSSLSHVDRLPIDKLKIDGSFIRGLSDASKRRAIVKTILDMCRNLGLDCVVEGVESAAELALLLPLGCQVAQGYLFSRPMSGEAVAGYLADERAAAAERISPPAATSKARLA